MPKGGVESEQEHKTRLSFPIRYGLSLALLALFLASWTAQLVVGWYLFHDEQVAHHQTATYGGYIKDFFTRTFENWQSEFLQLLTFGVLGALLYHIGSSESKDSEERIEAKVDLLLERVTAIEESWR